MEAPAHPRAAAYIALRGGTFVPPGRLEIDGKRMECGTAPTVLDLSWDDFGGSMPGFVILNPRLLAGLTTTVKLWIFSHECAHQTIGDDEPKADCIAVQRGWRERWLAMPGLREVCQFIEPARADQQHVDGARRCQLMEQCLSNEQKSRRGQQR